MYLLVVYIIKEPGFAVVVVVDVTAFVAVVVEPKVCIFLQNLFIIIVASMTCEQSLQKNYDPNNEHVGKHAH